MSSLCKKLFTIAAIFVIAAQFAYSATGGSRFTRLSEENSDLSCNYVQTICEDQDGFIWIGTKFGLNRYDGTKVVSYHADEMGLFSNDIFALCTDKASNLWISTPKGLAIFNKANSRFEIPGMKNPDFPSERVSTFAIDPADGRLWMGTFGGILSYAEAGSTELKALDSGLGYRIRRICFTKTAGMLILGNYGNLFTFDPETSKLAPCNFGENDNFFRRNNITAICSDSSNPDIVYGASPNAGLFMMNLGKKTVRILASLPPQNNPCDITSDGQTIYLATKDGLVTYNILLSELKIHRNNPADIFSISGNNLSCVFCDFRNRIWAGTYYNGANLCDQSRDAFESFQLCADGSSLSGSVVISFTESNGIIYLGTESGDICSFNPQTGDLRRIGTVKDGIIRNILSVGENIWITLENGIARLNTTSGTIKHYPDNGRHSSTCIFNCGEKDIYSTTKFNILKYNAATDSMEAIVDTDGKTARKTVRDKYGNVWILTYSDGLFLFNPNKDGRNWTKIGKERLPLDPSGILQITSAADSTIRVVSSCCDIYSFNPESGIFEKTQSPAIKNSDHLSGKIILDRDGSIWMPYLNAISYSQGGQKQFISFTEASALLHNGTVSSSFRALDGRIYFGARDGFLCFFPEQVLASTKKPEAHITDFTINGKQAGSIRRRFDHNERSFGFRVVCPRTGNAGMIAYKLEGYDKTFQTLPTDGQINYYNLPCGNYTLHLAYENKNGNMEPCHEDIGITIQKPFLSSLPGIALMIFVFFAIIAALIHWISLFNSRKSNEKLLLEKMSFFSGVVHELKTPLTLITSPLKNILNSPEQFSNDVREDLKTIKGASDYIQSLVAELMNYLKSENSGYYLSKETINICRIVANCRKRASSLAETRQIQILCYGAEDEIPVYADERAVEKILNNLLQNALKHAAKKITIRVENSDAKIKIHISNDGPLVPQELREKIFEPFFQYGTAGNDPTGSFGIGLTFSRKLARLHGGDIILSDGTETEFIITLPVGPIEIIHHESPDSSTDDRSGKQRILIVEDDVALASYTSRKLSAKYSVNSVETAEEALKLLRSESYDILVTDIGLDGMSGKDLCTAITSDEMLSHIPIIIISAMFEESVKIDCIKAGASIFIEKPFTEDYLLACIDNVAGRKEKIKAQMTNGMTVSKETFNIQDQDADFLNKVEIIIQNHIEDENFSVHTLCDELYMSQSTVLRKTNGLLGITPADFIKERRLITAAQMLSRGNVTVGEVCYRVGFSSKSYFSRCFKERFGKTPTEYSNNTLILTKDT